MDADFSLVISYFDSKQGPTQYLKLDMGSGPHFSERMMKKALNFMDFDFNEETFVFSNDTMCTYNFSGNLDADFLRGGKQLVLITMMVDEFPSKDIFEFFKNETRRFWKKISGTDEIPHVLNATSNPSLKNGEGFKKKYDAAMRMIKKYYLSLGYKNVELDDIQEEYGNY